MPHPLRRCLREYLCRRLLRRLSHSAFSMMDVTDVSARAGIVSASGSTIAAVSTITGVGRVARSVSRADDLGFVVPATEYQPNCPLVRKSLRVPPAFAPAALGIGLRRTTTASTMARR